ncbi:hypothetical protein [Umezawaea beigongshangensis]|uniref:hypothetical protein n=1 Tax=Umezawaea beigongshangensis TaxID=2780383 RepID=UPI0018F2207A|nr:hypothetical protein [Umezawaea beigongshangensis]
MTPRMFSLVDSRDPNLAYFWGIEFDDEAISYRREPGGDLKPAFGMHDSATALQLRYLALGLPVELVWHHGETRPDARQERVVVQEQETVGAA